MMEWYNRAFAVFALAFLILGTLYFLIGLMAYAFDTDRSRSRECSLEQLALGQKVQEKHRDALKQLADPESKPDR